MTAHTREGPLTAPASPPTLPVRGTCALLSLVAIFCIATLGCGGNAQKRTPRPTGSVTPSAGSSEADGEGATHAAASLPLGFPNEPDHYLASDMAPTPYTALEMMNACPVGRVNTFGMARIQGNFIFVEHFVENSDRGVKIQQLYGRVPSEDPKKNPPPTSQEVVMTPREFQSRASFPSTLTKISRERITVDAGEYDCWKYEVREGVTLTKYWFPIHLAGSPVRTEIYRGDEWILTMELTDIVLH